MALEYAILGFLEREPMTGYDLKTRCFDTEVGHVWTADQAQVYRTLDRLAKGGLVKPRLVPQRGKPDRKVFRITARGRAALAAWLRRTEDPPPLRDPLLLHLYLASEMDDDEILRMLEDARTIHQRRLADLRAQDPLAMRTEGSPLDPRDAVLREMTLAAAMSAARTSIDWIDDTIERIREGLPARAPAGGAEERP